MPVEYSENEKEAKLREWQEEQERRRDGKQQWNAPIRKGKLQGRNAHCPTSSAKPGNGTQRKSRRGSITSLNPPKGKGKKKNRKSPGSKNNRSKGRLAKNAAKAEAKYSVRQATKSGQAQVKGGATEAKSGNSPHIFLSHIFL
jgi:hypothetical protein